MKISEFVSVHDREDGEAKLVMHTTAPFVIASLLSYNSRRTDKIEEVMSNIVNGRWVGYRVPGYSVFVMYRGNLQRRRLTDEQVQEELRAIAGYVKDVIIPGKPGKYARTADNFYED